jgi:hypothetical protein
MKHKTALALSITLLLLTLALFANRESFAQSNSLMVEVEQHWDTYGTGGTCTYGSHNLFVADIDNDGAQEMITGGFSYNYLPNGNRTPVWAPFKIWNWDGTNLALEKTYSWTGNILCVYAGDANGDGKTEIITTGRLTNNTNSVSSLRIWRWNGQDLVLRGSYEDISVNAIFVGDVDKDNKPEIVTVARAYNITQSPAQLSVWQWDGNSFSLKKSAEWTAASDIARGNSVNAGDLDKDGVIEIVTCGYVNNLKNCSGQVCVWQFDGTDLSMKANAEWRMVDGYSVDNAGNVMGNTMAHNVKVGDVDDDGFLEIVTGGFTYDGEKVEGQLRIWNWTGGTLNLEKSQEWMTLDITEPKSISINDVDGDGKIEIVTSGSSAGYGSFAQGAANKAQAQIRVWSWDGNTLTLKQSKDWIVGEAVCAWNVGTGDVDNDGVVEIVTVGCMQIENSRDCDPDLRIWSLPAASAPLASFPYLPVVVVGAAAAAIVVAVATFMFMRKRRQ